MYWYNASCWICLYQKTQYEGHWKGQCTEVAYLCFFATKKVMLLLDHCVLLQVSSFAHIHWGFRTNLWVSLKCVECQISANLNYVQDTTYHHLWLGFSLMQQIHKLPTISCNALTQHRETLREVIERSDWEKQYSRL